MSSSFCLHVGSSNLAAVHCVLSFKGNHHIQTITYRTRCVRHHDVVGCCSAPNIWGRAMLQSHRGQFVGWASLVHHQWAATTGVFFQSNGPNRRSRAGGGRFPGGSVSAFTRINSFIPSQAAGGWHNSTTHRDGFTAVSLPVVHFI